MGYLESILFIFLFGFCSTNCKGMELASSGWIYYIFLFSFGSHAFGQSTNMLAGTRTSCNIEGEPVTTYPCYSCICKNFFIECKEDYPTEGCHMLVEKSENGCSKCKGCMYKGVKHESHTEWTEPEEPCKALRCEAGVVTESELKCHTPCENPDPPGKGQCCPTCSECKINGQLASEDRDVTSDDPCLKCRCSKGKMICSKKACPVLQCSHKYQHQAPGECCPKCFSKRKPYHVPKRCFLGTGMYIEGEKYDIDHCTTCTCSNETSVCHRKSCPILNCSHQYQIKNPDRCCKICRTPEQISSINTQCSYRGNTYEDGQTWQLDACSSCKCQGGMPRCAMTRCNDTMACPQGTHFVREAGECCGKCKENEGVCMVFGDPHYKTFDGKMYRFQGVGKYQLVSDCHAHTFSIRVTNAFQTKNRYSTLTKRVSIKSGGIRIILGQRLRVKVDGEQIKMPYKKDGKVKIEKEHLFASLTFSTGVKVLWNGKSFLEITVPTHYKNRLCGLCGNFNGNINDDFRLRNKSVVSDNFKFGMSWCVGKNCAKQEQKTAQMRECNNMRSRNMHKKNNCKYLATSKVFKGCDSKLHFSHYYQACQMDMCDCPNGKCYCESLMAYAQECKRLGVNIQNWQKISYCTGNNRRSKPTTSPYSGIDIHKFLQSQSFVNKTRNRPPALLD